MTRRPRHDDGVIAKMLQFLFRLVRLVVPVSAEPGPPARGGNPLFPGWHADPEAVIVGDEYRAFPTPSAPCDRQFHLD